LLEILALALCAALANPYETQPAPVPVAQEDPLVWEIQPVNLTAGIPGQISVTLVVPDGWVVYRDMLEVDVEQGPASLFVGEPQFPPAKDDATDHDHAPGRPWYDHPVVVRVPVRADEAGLGQLMLKMRHQVCRGGLCYSPREARQTVFVNVTEPVRPSPALNSGAR